MAEIELTRPGGYRVDRGREYRVILDRKNVGSIKSDERKVFTLPAGRHELQLKQDWASSEKLRVDLRDEDCVQFICAPRIKENGVSMMNGLRVIYWATLGSRRYIDLRQGDQIAPVEEPGGGGPRLDGLKLFGLALLIGIAVWATTGERFVVAGVLVGAMAIVVAGLIARGVTKVAVDVNEEVEKRRGGSGRG